MSEDFEQLENGDENLLSEDVNFNFDDILGNENSEISMSDNDDDLNDVSAFDGLFASDGELNDFVSDSVDNELAENHDVENEPGVDIFEEEQDYFDEKTENSEVPETEIQMPAEDVFTGEQVVSNENFQAAEDARLGFLRWYDGESNEPQFEVSKDSGAANLSGSEDCNIIHINIGSDAYGWLVVFENGIVMSVNDVREYQLRNGALPYASGAITYGSVRINFDNIEKIKIYESVRYFTYA